MDTGAREWALTIPMPFSGVGREAAVAAWRSRELTQTRDCEPQSGRPMDASMARSNLLGMNAIDLLGFRSDLQSRLRDVPRMHQEHWRNARSKHALRHIAVEEMHQASAAVRGHDDEIDASLDREPDDC